MQRWSPGYLKDIAGDRDVLVREVAGPPVNIFQKAAGSGWIRFADYLDWVLDVSVECIARRIGSRNDSPALIAEVAPVVAALEFDRSYYLSGRLAGVSPVLARDVCTPRWLNTAVRSTTLWCGVLGTSCGLHCDLVPNCNVQVIGYKHFALYPPGQTSLLYRMAGRTHCHFDPAAPDFDAYPDARRATPWECTLRPGEALYIPAGWYHQVTVVSGWAVNVNTFWNRPRRQGLTTPALWPHLLRQTTALVAQRIRV